MLSKLPVAFVAVMCVAVATVMPNSIPRGNAATMTGSSIDMEDNIPARSLANPLLSRGAPGSFDASKIGPRAILREGPNDWKMWYEAVQGPNQSTVGYATSTDGIKWTKYAKNPVMIPTMAWEGAGGINHEDSPTTVLKEHGLYEMWYHAIEGTTRRIGYATSPDGITWTKYSQNPVLSPGPAGSWDADTIANPTVVKVGALYYMYYLHSAGKGGYGLAVSSDRVDWTKYAANPVLSAGPRGSWDGYLMGSGNSVVYDGQRFHMWFTAARDSSGFLMGYAGSADGKSWTQSPNNPIMSKPSPPLGRGDDFGPANNQNVIRRGGQWWVFYGGFVRCCPEDMGTNLALVTVKTSPNMAPVVDAGADQTVRQGSPAVLTGTVMDDDDPVPLKSVSKKWTMVSGPGRVSFRTAKSAGTVVTMAAPGRYDFRLTANDTQLSGSADVFVTVT